MKISVIESLRERYFNLLIRFPGWFLVFFLIVTLVTGYGFTKFRIDVSSRPFFPKDDPATLTLEKFHKSFPTHETILLAVVFPETVFTDRAIDHLKELTRIFSEIPDVSSVWSLVNVDTLAEHLVGTRNWKGLEKYMLENPRYRSSLVSSDGTAAVIVMSPPPEQRDTAQERELIRRLFETLHEERMPGCTYHLSGMPVIKVEFSDLILKDQRTFGFLAAILLSLFMFRLFRTFWGVLAPLSCGGLSVVWTLGLFFATGHSINLVSSVLSLVIVVISMANCIHLMNYFIQLFKQSGDKKNAMREALGYALLPCFISTMTTIMGFLSLTTSRIPAVLDFVLFASLGILVSFLLTGSLIPILLLRWVDMPSAQRMPLDRGFVAWVLEKILWLVENRRVRVALVSTLLFSAMALGVVRIRTTMDVMASFPKDSPLRAATVFLQKNFSGAHVLEVMVTAEPGKDLLSIDNIRKVEAFDRRMKEEPEVNRTLSALLFAGPYLKNFMQAPETLKRIMPMTQSFRSTLAMMHPSQRDLLKVFVDPEFRTFRITVFLNTSDSRAVTRLADRIEEEGETILGPEMSATLTGELLLFSRVSTDMVGNLLTSLFQAFGIILLGIGLLFRSVKAVLVSILPNLLPVAALFGIMGWLGIPLSVPTSIVACIVLGLAVDDTAHFLHNFQQRRKRGIDPVNAARRSLAAVGRAMIFTSLILSMGFWLGLLSPFDLIVQFGFLAGITVLIALWCDLILLPICIMVVERVPTPGRMRAAPLVFLGAVCLLFGLPGRAAAEAGAGVESSKTLRLATLAPEGTAWADAAHEVARVVHEKTEGAVSLKWYMGAVMGDEGTMLKAIRSGRLDGAVLSMAGLSQISSSVSLLGMPLLFEDIHEAREIIGAFTAPIQQRFQQKEMVLSGMFSLGFGRIFTVPEVRDLQQLNKLRIWTWKGDRLSETALQALGFHDLVSLDMTDVLPGLQFDLLDAFSGTYYSITVLQWFPYAHHVVPLNWTCALGGLVFSRKSFSSLAREQQTVLQTAMDDFLRRLTEDALRNEQEAEEGMGEINGLGRIRLSEGDVALLRERARTFYKDLAADIKEENLLDEILHRLSETRSNQESGAPASRKPTSAEGS